MSENFFFVQHEKQLLVVCEQQMNVDFSCVYIVLVKNFFMKFPILRHFIFFKIHISKKFIIHDDVNRFIFFLHSQVSLEILNLQKFDFFELLY